MRQDLREMPTSPKAGLDGIISFLSAIVDSSDDAIVSKTLDGTIVSWNPAAERMFGYSAAEAIGRHITLIIPPERHAEEAEVLAQIRRGGKVDHLETPVRADGGVQPRERCPAKRRETEQGPEPAHHLAHQLAGVGVLLQGLLREADRVRDLVPLLFLIHI